MVSGEEAARQQQQQLQQQQQQQNVRVLQPHQQHQQSVRVLPPASSSVQQIARRVVDPVVLPPAPASAAGSVVQVGYTCLCLQGDPDGLGPGLG